MNKTKKILCLILIFIIVFPITTIAETSDVETKTVEISAPIAILMDGRTGKVLYDKNAYAKAYPASLTKMLTAIVVMENCELTDIVTYSNDALRDIQSGYITSNLTAGEELTVEQMLNLLLISSYNDIANMLAIHVSGSVDAFVELMNKKAEEIGCKNSHFMNTNGTHDENHYTTAYDMALIAKYAMQYEELRDIVSKIYFKLGNTNKYTGEERIYETTNGLLLYGSESSYYKYAKGIKTGFTTPAGSCLASYAVKNDMELYAVVLKCTNADERYVSIKTLYEYGFNSYSNKEIAKQGENIQTIDVKGGTAKTKKLNAVLESNITVLVNNDTEYTIEPKVEIDSNLKAPIEQGTKVGTVTYEIEGITYESNLLAGNEVKKTHMPEFFIILFIALIIIFGIFKLKENQRKKMRMKRIKSM